MSEMCFCNPFSHTVHVDVQSWKVFVKHHYNVLSSSVCKRWNKNGPASPNNVFDRIDESTNLLFFGRMIPTTVRTFDEQNVCLNGFSPFYERRISRVKIAGQKNAGFGSLDVKHGSARYVAGRVQSQLPCMVLPRDAKIMHVPRIKRRVDVSFIPSKRVPLNGTDLVAITPHHV